MKLRQKQDTGVQCAFAMGVSDDDRTGTAVAFVAAFFGAGQVAGRAQPIEQRLRGGCFHLHGFPIEKKRDFHIVDLPRYPLQWGRCAELMRRKPRAP